MAGHTVVNLKEVEDLAPKHGLEGLEMHYATGALDLQKSGLSYQHYEPGARTPFGHSHEQQEEVYVILGGSARLKLDDEIIDLKQWDAVRVPPATTRCFEGGPEGLDLLAIGAPAGSDTGAAADADMQPGWWSD